MVTTRLAARSGETTGILLMLSSCALLTLGDAVSKLLTESYPVGQVIFTRSALIIALAVLVCALRGRTADLRPNDLRGQIGRGVWFAGATFCFVTSISILPLPVVSAIMFAAPIILTALVGPMLGETVGWRRWLAVLAGFCGVLLIVDPFGGWRLVALVPVLGAFVAAMRDLVTRRVAVNETTASVLVVSMAVTLLPAAATVPFGWAFPAPWDMALFALVGLTQGAAFYMQVAAFQAAEAGLVAPYKYSIIVWSTLLGFLIWGDVPTVTTVAGAVIVVASGAFIFHRELRLARRSRTADL